MLTLVALLAPVYFFNALRKWMSVWLGKELIFNQTNIASYETGVVFVCFCKGGMRRGTNSVYSIASFHVMGDSGEVWRLDGFPIFSHRFGKTSVSSPSNGAGVTWFQTAHIFSRL